MDMDFLGFKFYPTDNEGNPLSCENGKSYYDLYEDFGMYRVSSGSRYQDDTVPQFKDETQTVPGGRGTYYWGSSYTQKTHKFDLAYDEVDEERLRLFRKVFNGEAQGWLVYNEAPWKKYKVKVQSPPSLKYVPFENKHEYGTIIYGKSEIRSGRYIYSFNYKTGRMERDDGTDRFLRSAGEKADFIAISDSAWEIHRNLAVMFPITKTWNTRTRNTTTYFYTSVGATESDYPKSKTLNALFSLSKYSVVTGGPAVVPSNNLEYCLCNTSGVPNEVRIADDSYNEVSDFIKQFKNTDILIYELEVPTTLTHAGEDFPYRVCRLYKGEGTLQFVSYNPIAKSTYKYFNKFEDETNRSEWKGAVNLLDSKGTFDAADTAPTTTQNYIYNPGDMSTEWIATVATNGSFSSNAKIELQYRNSLDSSQNKTLSFVVPSTSQTIQGFKINSKTHLIECYNDSTCSSFIKFAAPQSGDFFQIPVTTATQSPPYMQAVFISSSTSSWMAKAQFNYDYLYF